MNSICTKNTQKFCANYPCIEVNGVNDEAYNCVNNDCANYLGCADKSGSNYPGCTVMFCYYHNCNNITDLLLFMIDFTQMYCNVGVTLQFSPHPASNLAKYHQMVTENGLLKYYIPFVQFSEIWYKICQFIRKYQLKSKLFTAK